VANERCKLRMVKIKYLVGLIRISLLVFIIISHSISVSGQLFKGKKLSEKTKNSTVTNSKPNNLNLKETNLKTDTTKTNTKKDSLSSLKISVADSVKGDLETTVKYSARDSSIIDEENQTMYLYGNAKVVYGDIQLEAEYITLDWKKNEVFAVGKTDSTTKKKVGYPVFTQDGTSYDADTVKYNFKSRKGLIRAIVTAQNDGFVQGQRVKKDEEENMYLSNATYTTCDLEHPHFNILATKIKMVNAKNGNKSIIAGPFTFVVGGVPFPLKFPFGFFPFYQPKLTGRSGILIPTYGEEPRGRGFFLRDGGYYFVINEHITTALIGDIYSKGGWGIGTQTQYIKKYRYSGNLNFRFNLNKTGDEYIDSKSPAAKDFRLDWSHSPVPRGSSSFSAQVGLQSTGFGTRQAQNTQQYLQSTSNSSVSYSKTFGNWATSSTNARVSQNMVTGVFQGGLGLNLSVNQFTPLKRKNAIKEAWYETFRVGITVNGSMDLTNDIRTVQTGGYGEYLIYKSVLKPPVTPKTEYDRQFGLDPYFDQRVGVDIFKNWNQIVNQSQPQINYQVPITLPNFKILKYLNFTPSVSMQGNVYTKKLSYDKFIENDTLFVKIDTTRGLGFYPVNQYSFNASMNTRIFGTFKFKKGRTEAIRHTMAPSLTFSYAPDFSDPSKGQFQDVTINKRGDTRRLSRYVGANSVIGKVGAASFSIANTIEAKVRAKSDTAKKEVEKIALIDNFNISGGYNFLADSFNLSNIGLSMNTQLFKKITINVGATLDPYSYNTDSLFYNPNDEFSTGLRQNKFLLSQGKGLASLANFNIAFSHRLAPKGADKKKVSKNATEEQIDFINKNPDLYVDFSIPWSLSFSYNFNYTKIGFAKSQVVQALTFNGDLSLTEKWKMTYNSGYDFVSKSLTYTNLAITRDLHCWQMNLNWTPIAYGGRGGAYSFEIRAKSSILQELKLAKRGSPTGFVNF
jgi:lipopolysaccharide assembly outer membrane protein LptD (OstA)